VLSDEMKNKSQKTAKSKYQVMTPQTFSSIKLKIDQTVGVGLLESEFD